MNLLVTEKAQKDLAKLDLDIAKRVYHALQRLQNGEPVDLKKLRGTPNEWRLRVGDYRVLLSVEGNFITVYALRVLHRRESYRK